MVSLARGGRGFSQENVASEPVRLSVPVLRWLASGDSGIRRTPPGEEAVMGEPRRIQRKRTKGWRLPENTVIVTRPGPWGNPFTVTTHFKPGHEISHTGYFAVPTVEDAIDCFRIRITECPQFFPPLEELRGKNLACWCPLDQPCHADVLLELANAPTTTHKGG